MPSGELPEFPYKVPVDQELPQVRVEAEPAGRDKGVRFQHAADWNAENESPKQTMMRKQGIPIPADRVEDSFGTKTMVQERGIPWHEGQVCCAL